MNFQKNIAFGIKLMLLLVLFASCKTKYRKIQDSTDLGYKYEKAKEFYNNGDYAKALPLLEELLTAWRGTPKAQDVYYFYAYTQYNLGYYQLASFHFKNYASTYTSSKNAEECQFMYAYCLYLDSPNYSLDQSSTKRAIDAFQLYINKYPESERVAKANEIMDKLRDKLEEKSFNTAILFHNMQDFRAAAVCFENTLSEFPDIEKREEISFLIVESYFKLAENSILSKKKERYEKAIEFYKTFKEDFPESSYLKQATKYFEKSKTALSKFEK